MATLVTFGDRLITSGGRESWLKRPSVPFAQYGQGHLALGNGLVESYQQLYDTQPAIGAVVNKLTRAVIRLPLKVYREVSEDGECEPVHQHELVDLLRRPYKRASASTLKQKLTFPAMVHGNSLLLKVRPRRGATPDGLVPLDWRYMTAHGPGDGTIDFWECTQVDRPRFIAPEDVVHLAFDAGNGDLGLSPLKHLGTTLRIEDNAQRYQASSFENGVRPSGAYVTPSDADLDAQEREELRDEIRAMHAGSDRMHDFMLLTGGGDWKPFSHTAVEAALIEQRKLNMIEVCAVYDVDPPIVAQLDHATFSNIGEMYRRFYGSSLGPWLSLQADTLNAQLVDLEPRWLDERLFVAYDLTEVLKSNTPDEINAIATAIGTGVMTPNEGRQRLGWRMVENAAADELYMPTNNMTPLGEEPPAPEPPAVPPPDPSQRDEEAAYASLDRARQVIASKLGAGKDWDRQRVIRELAVDAPSIDGFAMVAHLEAAVEEASGDPKTFHELAAAITPTFH